LQIPLRVTLLLDPSAAITLSAAAVADFRSIFFLYPTPARAEIPAGGVLGTDAAVNPRTVDAMVILWTSRPTVIIGAGEFDVHAMGVVVFPAGGTVGIA